MISCRQARHLFDAFLDDELSPGLRAELHAHRLNCPDCSHQLAILEACADVVRTDRRDPALHADFTDRVMVAFAAGRRQPAPTYRWRRVLVFAGSPLAAAAVLVFAVMAWTQTPSRNAHKVAGDSVALNPTLAVDLASQKGRQLTPEEIDALKGSKDVLPTNVVLEAWLRPEIERASGILTDAQQGASHLADFLRSRVTPPQVLFAGEPVRKAPAPGVESEVITEDGGPSRFDTELPEAEHNPQPESTDVAKAIELM